MSKNIDETTFLDKFHEILSDSKLNSLFGKDYVYDNLDTVCIEYLKYRGFVVPNKVESVYTITKIDQLIDLFYLSLYKYHPDYVKLYRDKTEDRRSVSAFVKSRQTASETSRKEALKECATIICTFFKYEDDVGFLGTVSLSVFSSPKLKWILNKVLLIINDKTQEKNKKRLEDKITEITHKNESENTGFGNLDTILNNIRGNVDGK